MSLEDTCTTNSPTHDMHQGLHCCRLLIADGLHNGEQMSYVMDACIAVD